MKLILLEIISIITNKIGIKGLLVFIIGSLLCFIILVWTGIILLGNILIIGNVLNSHNSTPQVMTYYSIASVIFGFSIALFVISIANLAERMASEYLSDFVLVADTAKEELISRDEHRISAKVQDDWKLWLLDDY